MFDDNYIVLFFSLFCSSLADTRNVLLLQKVKNKQLIVFLFFYQSWVYIYDLYYYLDRFYYDKVRVLFFFHDTTKNI